MINRMLWGGAPSFPPFLETDTSLWLKADNPLNTNTRWYDASPNNHVLTGTATLTNNVLNGKKGYIFNGTTNYFDGGDILDIGTNEMTLIVIAKTNNATGTFFAKSRYGAGASTFYLVKLFGEIYSAINEAFVKHNNTSTNFLKLKTVRKKNDDENKHYHYLNDVLKGSINIGLSDVSNSYNFIIGAFNSNTGGITPNLNYYLDGTICEIIRFDRLLTTAENTEINAYLNTKYGL